MNEVYILSIIKTLTDSRPEIQVSAYRDMFSAGMAYRVAVDEAREEAENYDFAHEDSEIVTETYKCFHIEDLYSNDSITIEIQQREIIGEDPDDI